MILFYATFAKTMFIWKGITHNARFFYLHHFSNSLCGKYKRGKKGEKNPNPLLFFSFPPQPF